MERRRAEEEGVDYRRLRQDWCLGSEQFRQHLLASPLERVGSNHYGVDRQQTSQEKARRIIAEELGRLGWDPAELEARRKSDGSKVAIARRLRQETTMSLKWVAENLKTGTWTTVANLLGATTTPGQL